MKTFNSLQVVGLFAGMPLIAGWLEESGRMTTPVSWVFWIIYVILFILMVVSVRVAVDDINF